MCEFCGNIPHIERYEKISKDGRIKIVTYKGITYALSIDGSYGLFVRFCPICGRDLRSE